MLPVHHAHRQSPLLEHSIRADLHTYLSPTDLTPIVELVLSIIGSTIEPTLQRDTPYLEARRSHLLATDLFVTPPLQEKCPCAEVWVWHIANGTVLISFKKSVFNQSETEEKIRLGRLYSLSEDAVKARWVALAKFGENLWQSERTVQIHLALQQVPHTVKLLSALNYQKYQEGSLVNRTALLFPLHPRGSLQKNLRTRPFPTMLTLRTFQLQFITAIEELHRLGWVCRDLTLEKILLSRSQGAVLCGLGSACKATELQSISSFIGTLSSIPPEAIRFFHCAALWIIQPRRALQKTETELTTSLQTSLAETPLLHDLLGRHPLSTQDFPNPHTFSQEALKAKKRVGLLMQQRLHLEIIHGFQILGFSSLSNAYEHLLMPQWEQKPLVHLTSAIDAWSLGIALQALEPVQAHRASGWLKGPLDRYHHISPDLLLLANQISAAATRAFQRHTPGPFQNICRELLHPDPEKRLTVAQAKQKWQMALRAMEQAEGAPDHGTNPLQGLNSHDSFSPTSGTDETLDSMYLPPDVQPPPLPLQQRKTACECPRCAVS